MYPTWNLSSERRRFDAADVLVISVGKSGRTWFRVALHKYLELHFGIPFTLQDPGDAAGGIPHIHYSHETWSYRASDHWLNRLLGRSICPDPILGNKKVILIFRDPRDVAVSLYFQATRRSRRGTYSGSLQEFIRNRHTGLPAIIEVMNRWHDRLKDHPACLWISYERMHSETESCLRGALTHMGVTPVDDAHLRSAIEFASFENMKRMEAADGFQSPILRPRDPSDPESFKVRKGRVGGYMEHFGSADLEYTDRQLAGLHPFFGYVPMGTSERSTA
jgi:hypothetical protein